MPLNSSVNIENRYLISSLPRHRLTPEHWLLVIRRHWGVETSHQILDGAFAEDDPWIATASQHAPIDFELCLPEKWADDAERRVKARIPQDVVFKTKIELAVAMIERAKRAETPGEIILADSAYGSSAAFRHEISTLGFDYAVGIGSQTKVCGVCSNGRLGTALTALDLA